MLTAAHCLDGGRSADGVTVYIGTHDLRDPKLIARGSKIDIHPTWKDNVWTGSDVAVLTLSSPVQYSDTVRPVCLSSDSSNSYADDVVVAAGWGFTSADNTGPGPSKLREVDQDVLTTDVCRNQWSRVSR